MGGPQPCVAAARVAVRRCLAEFPPGSLLLAAVSGGADSLALAAALAHEAPRQGRRGGAVTVDHGLQPGSAERAGAVAAVLGGLGLEPVAAVTVSVPTDSGLGLEAAARRARYAALDEAAASTGAAAVLLGHSRDDQAETVLLALARGAGARALAGMPASRDHYRRPLLGVSREDLRLACAAQGLAPWDDPQNHDLSFTRARVRHQALPALSAALGPGVTEALARTASQLRADAEVLDQLAEVEAGGARAGEREWHTAALVAMPAAVRTRVLRLAAIEAGCSPGALSARHIGALDAMVTDFHGQRWADLPGKVRGVVHCGRLRFS